MLPLTCLRVYKDVFKTYEIFRQVYVASRQVCTGVKQLCSRPWILHQQKFGSWLAEANRETKVHAKKQMQQPRETMPVARVRRQASPLDWRAKAEWLHRHSQHDNHQGEGNGCWIANTWIPGFQLLVHEVPSTEEPCSSTKDEDCPKASRRSWLEDHKLPQVRDQEQKEGKLPTCSHREHGWNPCLVWHAISQNRKCERYKNCVGQHNWSREIAVHCRTCVPGRRNEAEAHSDLQMKDLAKREVSTRNPRTLSSERVDGRSWNEAVGRESVAVTTQWSSEKEKSPCLGLQAHLVDSVKQAVRQRNTDITVIPGSLTSILQPLDVSLNKPFKDRLCERWNNWMIEGQKSFTPTGNMRAASLPTVCSWVLDAWRSLPAEMVAWSFKKCGISNLMDGTEDEILWEETEDVPTTPVDDEDEDEGEGVYADHLTSGRVAERVWRQWWWRIRWLWVNILCLLYKRLL